MSRSSSRTPSRSGHQRGAHEGGGSGDGDGGGGGGGGGGPLVKVAFARNQAEAEMLQALLLGEDIPSVLKRSRGFDNPEFLAAGPHDIYVSTGNAKRARELLAGTMLEGEGEERAELLGASQRPGGGGEASIGRQAYWFGIAVLAAIALVWVLYQLT